MISFVVTMTWHFSVDVATSLLSILQMTSFSMLLVVCSSSTVFLSCLQIATTLSAMLSRDPIISSSLVSSGTSPWDSLQVHCPSSQE